MPIQWFAGLFDYDRWMPRWSCGQWEPWEGWLYITSDVLIGLAYFAIPAIIFLVIRKRKSDLPFLKIFWLFILFILFCGATHFIDAVIFWTPVYKFSAILRFATALISWATVVSLVYTLPKALKLKTSVEFENELKHRNRIEKELGEKYQELELAQRIAFIASWEVVYDAPHLKISKQFCNIFGLDPNVPHDMAEVKQHVHPDDIDNVNKLQQETKEKGVSYDVQYRYIRPDNGEMTYIHTRGEPKYNESGDIIGMYGFSQDITQLKTTEVILEKRASELESINKELELFAYAASHDLQEPLRKLRAFGDRLSQRYGDQLDEQGQDYIRRMDNASERMQTLIDDILTYSRLSRNKDNREKVDLSMLVEEIASEIEDGLDYDDVKFEMDNLPTINAEPSQMRQLFQNLLSNAYKFKREGVEQHIIVKAYQAKGKDLPWSEELQSMDKYNVIEVMDNGIGFDLQFEEKIFVMFQRLHGRTEFKGTGIGLALCKKIVENHHGLIKVNSVIGEGSTFSVILPIKKN